MNKFKKLTFWFTFAWAIMMGGHIGFIILSFVLNNYVFCFFAITYSLFAVCIALMEKGIKTLNIEDLED